MPNTTGTGAWIRVAEGGSVIVSASKAISFDFGGATAPTAPSNHKLTYRGYESFSHDCELGESESLWLFIPAGVVVSVAGDNVLV